MLVQYVLDCEGKVVFAAHQIGFARSTFYLMLKEHKLWPLVNKVREERLARELKERQERKHGISNGRTIVEESSEA